VDPFQSNSSFMPVNKTTRNSEKGEKIKSWMKVRTLRDSSSYELICSLNPRLDLTFDISSEMNEICLVFDQTETSSTRIKKFEAFLRSENSGLIYVKANFAIDPCKAKSFVMKLQLTNKC